MINKTTRLLQLLIPVLLLQLFISVDCSAQPTEIHNLVFDHIPQQWDEGIPLGNGMLGALVWQKEGKLRISLDRADLWDLRPTKEIEKYTYQWAYQHKLSGEWDTVWKVADEPYDRDAAPTKIPGAAIEFDIQPLGRISSVTLDIRSAICTINWHNGIIFRICVDAENPNGRFHWQGISMVPSLIPPAYASGNSDKPLNEVIDGQDLRRLGYEPGKITTKKNTIIYTQQCWGPLLYQAAVRWKTSEEMTDGVFSISSHYSDEKESPQASSLLRKAGKQNFDDGIANHKQWWRNYWEKASLSIPDRQLEKQWYLELYKFGAASRKGAPPVSLQAVWTADNGKLPPWKGDFHNDLNTQLSYWPAYSANHLEEAGVFTDWLWKNKAYFEKYTLRVFGVPGINAPGVATLRGREMGGWHMYAMSPTVSCWLAQHFYMQWRYSNDRQFLSERAFPWFEGVATYLEGILVLKNGLLFLPMSSSPEFHDGGINAWFLEMTNYDRALCRYTFEKAAELAVEMNYPEKANHWDSLSKMIPALDIHPTEGLTVAPGYPYHESHRHFSHLMALHPLGLLDFSNADEREVMLNSVRNLELQGTDWWCGYSFSWLANIYARLKMGEKSRDALRVFSSCFCSPNSFHLNGDQCKAGHSKMTYRPFTLEGNFAFAAGIQEMLIQSHSGSIEVFPAIPGEWKNASFKNLRTEGAFLVSAEMVNGTVQKVIIRSETGGKANLLLPFHTFIIKKAEDAEMTGTDKKTATFSFKKNGIIEIENGFE